ncbi:hypothetical protein EQM14_15960 [Caproiciproducens sp. NJN-50]|uniref:hypothetical protein n=1 Tax=Caproiciproducens sp. NJN-50 TaxID=2507162 RepID=UPI000FFE1F8A|nr:hypothetical protein [Caproiciproducens sp. NJN-50]QAT51145.1 hypothetical protein EQM14_15960 [Caproiciproducens sp. NJN-50]
MELPAGFLPVCGLKCYNGNKFKDGGFHTKIRNGVIAGALAAFLLLSGCGGKTAQAGNGSSSSREGSSQSAGSAVSRETAAQSGAPDSSQSAVSQSAASVASSTAPSVESKNYDTGYEISTDGVWEAYDSNKDEYKLHVRKKDGTGDKVIVDDIVLCPCIAGDWVYYISPLVEIDKIRLDGTGKTKVCSMDAFHGVCGSTAVTASYKDGAILYRTQQMRSVGDSSSYPAYYFSLDTETGTVTEVKN